MGTLVDPGPHDCLARLEPDEPYFLLRATDIQAPELVRRWARVRRELVEHGVKPASDLAAAAEAIACADAMQRWNDARLRDLARQRRLELPLPVLAQDAHDSEAAAHD